MHCHLRGKNSPPAGARHAGPSPMWALGGQSAHLAEERCLLDRVAKRRLATSRLLLQVLFMLMSVLSSSTRCSRRRRSTSTATSSSGPGYPGFV